MMLSRPLTAIPQDGNNRQHDLTTKSTKDTKIVKNCSLYAFPVVLALLGALGALCVRMLFSFRTPRSKLRLLHLNVAGKLYTLQKHRTLDGVCEGQAFSLARSLLLAQAR